MGHRRNRRQRRRNYGKKRKKIKISKRNKDTSLSKKNKITNQKKKIIDSTCNIDGKIIRHITLEVKKKPRKPISNTYQYSLARQRMTSFYTMQYKKELIAKVRKLKLKKMLAKKTSTQNTDKNNIVSESKTHLPCGHTPYSWNLHNQSHLRPKIPIGHTSFSWNGTKTEILSQ